MARHYTPEEKRSVLERLIANHGDVRLTSAETGIPVRTLSEWRRLNHIPAAAITSLAAAAAAAAEQREGLLPPLHEGEGLGVRVSLPEDDVDALRDLKREMMANAYRLNNSIPDAIPEAPLPHRMAALAQLIDRIIKLSVQLAAEQQAEEEVIYRIPGSEGQEPDEETAD